MKKYTLASILANESDSTTATKELKEAMQIGKSRFYQIIKATWEDNIFATPIQLARAAKHLGKTVDQLINKNPEEQKPTEEPLTLSNHEGITLFTHMVGNTILLQNTQSHGSSTTTGATTG